MRAKKSLKNLIFNIFQQIVGTITGFILPPLIISTFGSSINGLVSTIKQFVQYAQLTGSGIASASTYAMYKPIADKDHSTLSGIFAACKKSFIKAGNIVSIIILLVALIYPYFVQEEVNAYIVIALILIIGACGISEFYFIGKYQALLSADQKNYMVAIAQTLGNILNIIITIVLIKLNVSIIFVQLGATIVYLTRVFILTWYFKKNYSYIDKTSAPLMDKISQRKDAIIHEVTALVVNTSSTILVSLMLGLESASVYSVYLLVFSGLNVICSIVSNGIYASFGDVVAKGEKDVLKRSYDIFEWGYLLLIFIVYTITYFMIIPFIQIYTKNIADINYVYPTFAALFVILGLINNVKIPSRTMVIASGHFRETKKYSWIEMILNLVFQIIFIPIFGLYGVLIGCLVSAIYRAFNFIWYTNKKILDISHKTILKRIIIYTITALLLIFSVNSLINVNVDNYLNWIMYALLISLIVGLVYVLIGIIFDKKTFKETTKVIKSVFNK